MKKIQQIKDFIIEKYEYTNYQLIILWLVPVIFSGLISVFITIIFTKHILITFIFLIIFFLLNICIMFICPLDELNIVKTIHKSKKNENWKELIRIAYPISQPIWYLGKFRVHYLLGREIVNACKNLQSLGQSDININDSKISLQFIKGITLIHNLGWTMYKLNPKTINQARENVKKGIDIAKDDKNIYLYIEGLKQLVTLQVEIDKSIVNIADFKDLVESLFNNDLFTNLNEEEQHTLKGNWFYTYAASILTTLKNNNNLGSDEKLSLVREAERYIKKSIEMYTCENPERIAKTFTVKVDLFIALGDHDSIIKGIELVDEGLLFCEFNQERNRFSRLAVSAMQLRFIHLKYIISVGDDIKIFLNETRKKYKELSLKLSTMKTDKDYKKELKSIYKSILIYSRNSFTSKNSI